MEHKDKNITSEAIAQQWIRLVLAHLQANKIAKNARNKNQDKEEHGKQ